MSTARERWQQRYAAARVREADFTTLSGLEVDPAYGTDDGEWPGEFPFTRGLYPQGYRGRTWTIRQFAGFGNARQTNERYRMILARGGGGLSVAFDMPTLMGRDSDDPRSLGEVGHCGVAVDSAADMDVLFDGIPLGEVTTSMTISGPAVPIFAEVVGLLAGDRPADPVAREARVAPERLRQRHAAPQHDRRVTPGSGVRAARDRTPGLVGQPVGKRRDELRARGASRGADAEPLDVHAVAAAGREQDGADEERDDARHPSR